VSESVLIKKFGQKQITELNNYKFTVIASLSIYTVAFEGNQAS
jgi:hypothetical protein